MYLLKSRKHFEQNIHNIKQYRVGFLKFYQLSFVLLNIVRLKMGSLKEKRIK